MDGITTILPVHLRNPDAADANSLDRAIDSVLSQDTRSLPHELLVIDDGSDPPIANLPAGCRIIRLRRNRGLSYALNAGLSQASHNLIARIDADDAWRPGKLARQLAMFAADPALTLVASSMRLHHKNPGLGRDELRGGDWAHTLALTTRIGCPFPHGSILARCDVFEQIGGYPQNARFDHAEDFALWAQWIRFFKVAIANEVFLDYTVSDSQISTRFATEQQKASHSAAAALNALGENRGSIPQAVESLAAGLNLDLLQASKILFTAWRFSTHILTDPTLYDAAATLFPDRAVHRCSEIYSLLGGRFYWLSRSPTPQIGLSLGAMVRQPT
ncbi:MAG TPA: glycosyltransferase [Bryobacteraceae bacterium]